MALLHTYLQTHLITHAVTSYVHFRIDIIILSQDTKRYDTCTIQYYTRMLLL